MARRLPRLRIASLADQVRLHARRFRAETCRDLCAQIDALLADADVAARAAVAAQRRRCCASWRMGYAAIAAQDWRARARAAGARRRRWRRSCKQGRLHIELLGLRALALDRCGEKSLPLLREAVDLAADLRPAAGVRRRPSRRSATGCARRCPAREPAPAGRAALAAPRPAPAPRRGAARPRATPSMALTPKEREVLELLARNLSNKEIGLAMQVGEETIKWHMKNLFAKLDAGTRKQVVQRARILGLLEAERLSARASAPPSATGGLRRRPRP